MDKSYNFTTFNQTRLYNLNFEKLCIDLPFKCKCNHPNYPRILDLTKAVVGNCYIHCNHCDAYYKLITDDISAKILQFYIEEISKKDVMESIMLGKYKYTLFEVE